MKTIILATSFSANSLQVSDYALELTKQLHTRLVIVHAYDPSPLDGQESGLIAGETNQQYMVAMHRLSRLRTRLMKATKGSVDVALVALPGDPATCLNEEAVRLGADLLIMGLVGGNPKEARAMGSLATRLIPRTTVSMLLVPPGAHCQAVQNIVLAVDLSQAVDAQSLADAKRFAQRFGATLDIICMADAPDAHLRKAAEDIRTLLSDQPHTFSFWPGDDLTVVLDNYFAGHRADLIMLLPKPHNRLQTFVLESVTQQIARQATTPVLAVV